MGIPFKRRRSPEEDFETEEQRATRMNELAAEIREFAPPKQRHEELLQQAVNLPPAAMRKFRDLGIDELDKRRASIDEMQSALDAKMQDAINKIDELVTGIADDMERMTAAIQAGFTATEQWREQLDRLQNMRRLPAPAATLSPEMPIEDLPRFVKENPNDG